MQLVQLSELTKHLFRNSHRGSFPILNAFSMSWASLNRGGLSGDFTEDFAGGAAWTTKGSGISVTGGVGRASTAAKNADNGIHAALGLTASDTLWYCNFDLITTTSSGAGLPIIFTAGTGDPTNATQDGLGIFWSTTALSLAYKDGAGALTLTGTAITISDATQYYCRVSRDAAGAASLSVFTDSARTVHHTDSPQTNGAPPTTVTGLTTVQINSGNNGGGDTTTFDVDNIEFRNAVAP